MCLQGKKKKNNHQGPTRSWGRSHPCFQVLESSPLSPGYHSSWATSSVHHALHALLPNRASHEAAGLVQKSMSVLYFLCFFFHLQSIWFCSESRRKGRGIRVVYVCSVACFQYTKTLGSQQRSWLLHGWLAVCCGEEPWRLCMKKSSATETQAACLLPFCLAAVSCHPLELAQNPSRIADL